MAPKAVSKGSLYPDEQALEGIRAQEKALRAQILALKNKEYRARKARQDTITLSDSFKWTLLVCYVLSSCSMACAQSFWVYRRKLKKREAISEVDMTRYLQDLFLATPLDSIWDVAEGNNVDHGYAQKLGHGWYAKWQLRNWLKAKNLAQGLAVPSRALAQAYNRLSEDIPFEIRPRPRGDPNDDMYCRVFLHRWRFAMRSKWGRISAQEYISLDDKRKKVPP